MLFGIELQQLMVWASVLSLGALLGTLIGVPWVVTRLPQNYFARQQREVWRESSGEPLFALLLGLLKNLLGLVLVILGIVMLLTPGQGLLTLLVGLLLLNFPGKFQLERWLVSRPGVMRALNWLRQRSQQAPFDAPLD